MSLPVPNLDDRGYQDLVDDAKRHVQRRCPSWTSHNVSDPGVTLIETFAYMIDQVLYRLNRVPDRLYVKFLDLIGVRLLPGSAARAPVTFWLSSPAQQPLEIAAGSEVATERTPTSQSISFHTVAPLTVVPCAFRAAVAVNPAGEPTGSVVTSFDSGIGIQCFSAVPQPGDALAVGLTAATPSCAVDLHIEAAIGGIGIEPEDPPIIWEAWTPAGWVACEADRRRSGDVWGLNRSGSTVLHVPAGHRESTIGDTEAAWLRCRVLPLRAGKAAYTASPTVSALWAATMGGTVDAINADQVDNEILGTSDGNAGQRFSVSQGPVVRTGEPLVVDVLRPVKGTQDADRSAGDEEGSKAVWEEWTEVENFGNSSPTDQHFVLDAAAGEVCFGPLVRGADGESQRYGARPVYGALVRIRQYHVGGSQSGNVDAGAISRLKSAIPTVAGVENRAAARGGADAETVDEAKVRGPVTLHARDRAVTREDFEYLASQASPLIARARCVELDPEEVGGNAPGVRVLIVPKPPHDGPRVTMDDLAIDDDTLELIRLRLDRRRVIGTRVLVQPPRYQPVIVLARIFPRLRAVHTTLEQDALDALHRYFNPVTGGPDGNGWPFGRPMSVGDAYAVLQQVRDARVVEEVRLVPLDPTTGQPGEHTQRIDIDRNALVVSADHQIKLEDE